MPAPRSPVRVTGKSKNIHSRAMEMVAVNINVAVKHHRMLVRAGPGNGLAHATDAPPHRTAHTSSLVYRRSTPTHPVRDSLDTW